MLMGFVMLEDHGIIGFLGPFFEVMENPDEMELNLRSTLGAKLSIVPQDWTPILVQYWQVLSL